jgi:flavin reductase (DIM6/NTAB) family NADH-FMN oxidoreductase RutF
MEWKRRTAPPSNLPFPEEISPAMSGGPTDPRWFRQVLSQYPTGACVVTAKQADGTRAGFVVGSFTSVSLDPPLIAFFPDKASTSWPKIQDAGRFCINILSSDQEDVCRRFAARVPDRFQGVPTREAGTGSPIIEGVVAWIDCELESVQEPGDHYIVLGRVLALEREESSLPLLFFQGGYGSFAPNSLAAANAHGLLTEALREVDLIRTEMERLATDLGARCIAIAPVEGEFIVVASVGSTRATSQATLVGQRLPDVPPTAGVFVAWMREARLETWLSQLGPETHPADERERLAVVRRRGYSVGLLNEAQRAFAAARDRLAADPSGVERDDLRDLVRDLQLRPVGTNGRHQGGHPRHQRSRIPR